jgi:DNA modification methylase
MLKMELADLEITMDELDISATGFSTIEVDTLLNGKPTAQSEKHDVIPFVPDNEVTSKLGDLWFLDEHRLLCGSSLDGASYELLMDGKLADQVLTDPPYNVSAASIGNTGKTKHDDFAMAAGEMTKYEFTKFLTDVMELCFKHSTAVALGYYWMDWRHVDEIMAAGRATYPLFVNMCVWSKATGGMGKLYRSQHELCFVFGKDKDYLDNVELGKHGRYRTNVWNYAGVNSFGAHKGDQKFHPTTKPYEMIKDIMLDAAPRGGIVLDPFIGSGTALIAAQKSKRICYGIELEPRYVDTAIRRFQDLFKIDAVHAATGKTYNQLLAEHLNNQGGKIDTE